MGVKELYPYLCLTPFIHYPNINNVSDSIDESERATILKSLEDVPVQPRKAQVYVHVPFCTTHCTFCFYNIRLAKEDNPIFSRYVDALIAEIELYASTAYAQHLEFEHVFVGGGTPSVLPAPLMDRLFGAIRRSFFANREPKEFSVEFALQTMTEDRVQACRDNGITRISFGWQTFSPMARKRMSLIPSEETLRQSMKLLRTYEYSVNTDLIFGLPEQTSADWDDDLKKALDFGFDGIDVFPIQPVPPSPLYSLIRQNKILIASSDELLGMLRSAVGTFSGAGYVRSNFQRFYKPEVPTSENRYNNALFSTAHDTISVGSGSIGMVADWAYMNGRNIDAYIEWKDTWASPASCATKMDDDKWVERAFCLQLPWTWRLRKETLRAKPTKTQRATIDALKSHGLLEETSEEYRLLTEAEGYNFNIARSFVSEENQVRNLEYAQSLSNEINWKPNTQTSVAV